jgi:outer membrane lipoprotein-sorting protein
MLESQTFRLLALSSALVLSIESAVASDAIDLEALVRGFAAMPGLSARFREEKQLSLLQVPLLSEGALYFAPPDQLVRHIEKPVPSTLLLRGDELVMGTAAEQHAINLVREPEVRSFVEAFRLVLAGDLLGLRARYSIQFRNTDMEGGWRILLMPRSERLANVIRGIEFTGTDLEPREMRVVEASGDTTTTRFFDVDRSRRFSAAEIDALFRISP